MKLEKWALLAEIISGVAIVVTVIILIVEVRGNTTVLRATNRQSIAERIVLSADKRLRYFYGASFSLALIVFCFVCSVGEIRCAPPDRIMRQPSPTHEGN